MMVDFETFLERNKLSRSCYTDSFLAQIPRTFTLNNFKATSEQEIFGSFPSAKSFSLGDKTLSWFEIDPSINVGSSILFKQGK